MFSLFKRKKNNFFSFFNLKNLRKKKAYKKFKKAIIKNYIFFLAIGMVFSMILGFLLIILIINLYEKPYQPEITQKNDPYNTLPDSPPPLPPGPTTPAYNNANGEHTRGNPDAPNSIIEYSDLECPYCAQFRNTMMELIEAHPYDLKWTYKHFPKSELHPNARKAAEASECASDQGKFWEYTDLLLGNQRLYGNDYFIKAAKDLNLNAEEFKTCLTGGKYASKVEYDYNYGREQGVTNTPTIFINGEKMVGSKSLSTLEEKINNK